MSNVNLWLQTHLTTRTLRMSHVLMKAQPNITTGFYALQDIQYFYPESQGLKAP